MAILVILSTAALLTRALPTRALLTRAILTTAILTTVQVVRAEGGGALYRGLGTSVVGIMPYAGIDLSINSLLKEGLGRHYAAR